jgi:spore coat polysaccharide biosynthesis predicted glycosyltransferase SpsG
MAKSHQDTKHLEFSVVAGRFNPHIEELNRLAIEYDDVIIHRNVKNMSQLMLDCDIAVSAGGSTLYELCACGTPTVTFALADNQLDGVSCFGDGYMINAGDIRENEELCLSNMQDGLQRLFSDYELRCDMTRKGQTLVDGRGALRIAEAILG